MMCIRMCRFADACGDIAVSQPRAQVSGCRNHSKGGKVQESTTYSSTPWRHQETGTWLHVALPRTDICT